MVVQHNMQAANANRMLNITTSAQSKSTEKLSSGYRINRAADDAAGLTISEKMRKQIKGLDRASTNAEDGVSAVQTAEGALTEVHSMLQRMNELATQSANGTNSSTDRKAIQDEIDQLTTEIDRVSETTKFNETYLLKGDGADKAHNVNAHDAGIDGVTLTDKGDTVDVTLKTLNAGDKVSIAGKNYTIGATADDGEAAFKKGLGHDTPTAGDTATLNGVEYKYYDAITANGGNKGTAAGWYSVDPSTLDNATSAVTAEKETTAFYAEGATTKVGNQSFTVMKGAADGIDDNDSSIITAKKAYQLETAEILKASNIGTDTAAPKSVNHFHSRVHCGIITYCVITASNIIVNRSGNTHTRDASERKVTSAAERTVSAYNNYALHIMLFAYFNCLFHTFFGLEFWTSCRIKNCTASVNNIRNTAKIHFIHITMHKTVPASSDSHYTEAVFTTRSYNGSDCGIHARSISAACQYANRFH